MIDKIEQEVKKSREKYREIMRKAKDPEYSRTRGEGKSGPRKKFTKLPNSIIDDDKLSCQEKMVYWVLLRYGQNRGECWPSRKLICKNAKIRKTRLTECLKSLNHKSYIKIIKTKGRVNHYRLLK